MLRLQFGVERTNDLGVTLEEAGPGGELLGLERSPRWELSGRRSSEMASVAHATQHYLLGTG